MALLDDLRHEAENAAGEIEACIKGHTDRKTALDACTDPEKRAALPQEWPPDEEKKYQAANKRYDEALGKLQGEERQAEMVARQTSITEFRNRRQSEPNNRPGLDQQVPGDDRSFGDMGLENRDETRKYEQRQADLHDAFALWAGMGVPQNAHTTEERGQAACQRLNFNPSNPYVEMRMLPTDTIDGFQNQMASVHPTQRGKVIDELMGTGQVPEKRALASGTGASGAYLTVPASVINRIELAMLTHGALLQFAETITTNTGEDMGWPVGDDTSNEASYTDENPVTGPADVDPSLENITWRAHDFQSGFVKVPFRLFRDTFTNLELLIGAMLGERFGRKFSGEATNGQAKVRGIIPRSPVGNTAASATAIVYDDVVDLDVSLDPAFQSEAAYMTHQNVHGHLRKIKDSQNRPLWVSNIALGAPDTFNGRRMVPNQKMDSAVTTGLKTMLLGVLRSYKWRRVGSSMRMRRLVERFAEKDQTAFIGYMSADGNLLRPNANASCPTQVLQQA